MAQNGQLVVIRTLDSSQRDVPVYVVFLQGVLTVPGGCLCQWAVWPSETFPQGVLWCQCSSRPTQECKRRSARVPCLPGHKFVRQKGPKGPFCGQIWSTFGKKVPCRAWGRVWYSGGSKKKSHVALGGVWGNKKKSHVALGGVWGNRKKKACGEGVPHGGGGIEGHF